MKTYTIGEIAEKYQLSTDTLRYYDKEGLLPFVKKNSAGRRVFTEDDLGYLNVIECLKKSATPVKDIATFMEWCMQGDGTLPDRYAFIVEQETILEAKIQVLEANLAFLRWKKWYYQKANEVGTETVFFEPGTRQVSEKWHQEYEDQLSKTVY
ncbi:MerR family transcriptional regulator [Enterococcus thailandicus]|uniref:MerR family transcriptional regulator n=1 Tax=Enterococcus thailandicus TaxID=417368 RepID=UPI0022EC030C|nr:MerR family transcriptional regulator [Enterococcus thailandicus]MDA3965804.1 MerR family transcriptional regulator [Enterococcus thailandicus]